MLSDLFNGCFPPFFWVLWFVALDRRFGIILFLFTFTRSRARGKEQSESKFGCKTKIKHQPTGRANDGSKKGLSLSFVLTRALILTCLGDGCTQKSHVHATITKAPKVCARAGRKGNAQRTTIGSIFSRHSQLHFDH